MIIVIDNYDSFTYNLVHLVARADADIRVYRNDAITADEIKRLEPDGILISPGPGKPEDAGITKTVIHRLGREIPVLGVCLGHQAIGEVFGGRIVHAPVLMHGKTSEIRHDGRSIFTGVDQNFTATRYHSLIVDRDTVPDELTITAETSDRVVMGLRHKEWPVEGIQFHPESVLTVEGPRIIWNWAQSLVSAPESKSSV